MSKSNLKIAIIGDYNFTYNTHHATNLSIDHASNFLELDSNYYWIRLNEAAQQKIESFEKYDGIWISPGPFKNPFLLIGILDGLIKLNKPILITGEGFKSLFELLIMKNNLNSNNEKLISENLVEGEIFQRVEIIPHSSQLINLYENHSKTELTSARYSLYPQLISNLINNEIDIEAYNHLEEPEIISLKYHDFVVGCGFCPQISSTREIPHPLVYTFIKACSIL